MGFGGKTPNKSSKKSILKKHQTKKTQKKTNKSSEKTIFKRKHQTNPIKSTSNDRTQWDGQPKCEDGRHHAERRAHHDARRQPGGATSGAQGGGAATDARGGRLDVAILGKPWENLGKSAKSRADLET